MITGPINGGGPIDLYRGGANSGPSLLEDMYLSATSLHFKTDTAHIASIVIVGIYVTDPCGLRVVS